MNRRSLILREQCSSVPSYAWKGNLSLTPSHINLRTSWQPPRIYRRAESAHVRRELMRSEHGRPEASPTDEASADGAGHPRSKSRCFARLSMTE
jgi:hypothetical protein